MCPARNDYRQIDVPVPMSVLSSPLANEYCAFCVIFPQRFGEIDFARIHGNWSAVSSGWSELPFLCQLCGHEQDGAGLCARLVPAPRQFEVAAFARCGLVLDH
jgi:hypothetical protein